MIVVDASAVLELLLRAVDHERLVDRVLSSGEVLAAPHLLDLEVAQVLRRFVVAGELREQRAREALDDYAAMRIARYPHQGMLERIWALRHNCTSYDAAYIALAESLGCPLITLDGPLAAVPGHRATVELFPG